MFDDKHIYNNKNDKIDNLLDFTIPTNRPLLIEPLFNSNSDLNPDLNPEKLSFRSSIQINKPDWTLDFSEKNDVVEDSINLALHTLGMSRLEYNGLNISELKTQKSTNFSCEKKLALNILIYYKKK